MSILHALSLPQGWRSVPFGRVAVRTKESGRPDLSPLSVFLGAGVVPRDSREDNHNQLGEDLGKYLVVQAGDLVFNKLRTWQGGLGASQHEGIVSPAYFVCRPTPDYDSRFLQYLLLSGAYLQELTRVSKWQPPSQFDIGWEQLRAVPIVSPKVCAQRAIADYLDVETARIDALIAKKERMNDLLREHRQALITAAVTGELEVPGVAAPGSAVRFVPLKRLIQSARPITYGIVQAGPEVHEGVPYIRPVDMTEHDGCRSLQDLPRTSAEIAAQYRRSSVISGDIVVSIGPSYGKTMIVPDELTGANLTQGTARVAVSSANDARFVRWCLRSAPSITYWDAAVGGATFRALNLAPLAETPIPLIPRPRQTAIADYLDAETARIDALIAKKERMNDLLREHRQALITAAVTGELEVPGVAA